MVNPATADPKDYGVRYWLQGKDVQNFGDYLTEFFLSEALTVPRLPAELYYLVGSVIDEHSMAQTSSAGPVAFWGCGLREPKQLSPPNMERALFCGVRGPLTRDTLQLPYDTTIGDPALILPAIYRPTPKPDVGSLCILHLKDPKSLDEASSDTGAQTVVRASVPKTMKGLTDFIDLIVSADIVLSGALHGAIVACAFDRPFAFYDSGFVDVPFKWHDFANSIGTDPHFCSSVKDAGAVYDKFVKRHVSKPPMTPILAAAPFAPRQVALIRAMICDGVIDETSAIDLASKFSTLNLDEPDKISRWRGVWSNLYPR